MLFTPFDENEYKNKVKINEGGFGEIYKAIYKGKNVALKVISKEKMEIENQKNKNQNKFKPCIMIRREIEIMTKLNSLKNSVHLISVHESEKEYIYVLEFYDTSLKDYLKKYKKLSEEQIYCLLIQLMEVFKKMDEENIIHRDIKPGNILLNISPKNEIFPILTDYGISKILVGGLNTIMLGTFFYIAPEILLSKGDYDTKADVFSLGVVIYECLHGFVPFGNINQIIHYYDKDNINFPINVKDESLKDLLKRMLKLNQNNRISWKEYFNHKYFSEKAKNKEKSIFNIDKSIIYYINKIGKVQIFGRNEFYGDKSDFVSLNKKNCYILINGKKEGLDYIYNFNSIGRYKVDIVEINPIIDISYMFYQLKDGIDKIELQNGWNTSNIQNIKGLFYYCSVIKSLEGLKNWDVSNIVNMEQSFADFNSISSIEYLKKWNTIYVQNISEMFAYSLSITSLEPLKNWNIRNVKIYENVFAGISKNVLKTKPWKFK